MVGERLSRRIYTMSGERVALLRLEEAAAEISADAQYLLDAPHPQLQSGALSCADKQWRSEVAISNTFMTKFDFG